MELNRAKNIEVIYIAGNGHSGSTLLDLILGDCEECFSAGELTNISRESIFDEYCSCGSFIKDCSVWKEVIANWSSTRQISMREFRVLRNRYERNKTFPRVLANSVWPSKKFLLYCQANKSLLESIQAVTGASIIIDSSKSAARILVLRRISDTKVIHLCRNFTGVMNSVGKFIPKNLEKGVEEDLHPTSPIRAFTNWVLNNALVAILSVRQKPVRVSYQQLVSAPDESIKAIDKRYVGLANKAFSPEHMLAGNVIRLRSRLRLDSNLGFSYKNLSKNQLRFGKFVDRVFFFWS